MKIRRCRITITIEEEVARWARVEAARHATSVSRLLAEILEDRNARAESCDAAKAGALARKPFLKSDSRYVTREEVHDRASLP